MSAVGMPSPKPGYDVYPGLRALISGILNEEERMSERKSTNPKDILASGEDRVLLHLIPSPALIETARAMMDGARKYGPYNWREEGVGASTYLSAAMRHVRAYLDGEQDAADSGVHHLGHAMACLAILLDAEAVGNLVDDRPLPAPTASLMDALKKQAASTPVSSTSPLDGLTSENTPDKYMAGDHSTARGVEPLDEYVGRRGAELGLFPHREPDIRAEDIHVDEYDHEVGPTNQADLYGVSMMEAANDARSAVRQAERELVKARAGEIMRGLRIARAAIDPIPPEESGPGGCC